MSILTLSNITAGYGKKPVLHNVYLEIPENETLLIVGSNGSGKSTLLKVVYGLLGIWGGTVEYGDTLLHDVRHQTEPHKLLEQGIMYIPQKNALFNDVSVEQNLQFSLLHLKNNRETKKRIGEVWEMMPVLQEKRHQLAGQLSGGERKLLSLAMVIVNRPRLLLYDEPLAGISEENIQTMLHWMKMIRNEGTTLVIVEHRIEELFSFVNRIVGLKLGHINKEELKTLNNIKKFMV